MVRLSIKIKSLLIVAVLTMASYGCLGIQGSDVVQKFQGLTNISVLSPNAVDLNWNASTHVIRYEIYSSANEEPIANTQATTYRVTNLLADHAYTFAVSAVYDDGHEEGISVEQNVVMWSEFSGVKTAATASASQVDLMWEYPQDGPVFYVYQNQDSVPTVFTTPVTSAQTNSVRVGNLKGSTTYYFIVRAKYLDGTTETNTVSVHAQTATAISPLPTVTVDSVTLGHFPKFTVAGALSGYRVDFYHGTTLLGYRMGNGTFTVPSSKSIPNGKQTFSATVSYAGNSTQIINLVSRVKALQQDSPAIQSYNRPKHGWANFSFPPWTIVENHYPLYYENPWREAGTRPSTMTTGDFNCDGYEDLAVAMPDNTLESNSVGSRGSGGIYVYYGSATGLVTDTEPSETPAAGKPFVYVHRMPNASQVSNTSVGYSMTVGNINGDTNPLTGKKCDDIIAGIPGYYDPAENGPTGGVLVLYGTPNGITKTVVKTAYTGNALQCSGGSCYNSVVRPAIFNTATYANHTIYGTAAYQSYMAIAMSTSRGDINNDGYDDIVVSARRQLTCASIWCGGCPDVGVVYVFYGSSCGLGVRDCNNPGLGLAWARIDPPVGTGCSLQGYGGMTFGFSLTMADTNHDSYSDIFIGSPAYAGTNQGRVYYINGSALSVKPAVQERVIDFADRGLGHEILSAPNKKILTYDSTTNTDRDFGFFLSNAGDVNGDSYDDLIIGDTFDNTSSVYRGGSIYVVYGSAAGPQDGLGYANNISNQCSGLNCLMLHYSPAYRISSGYFGNIVRGINDFDGDGFADVFVSMRYNASASKPDVGLANVLYGSSNGLKINGGTRFSPSSLDRYDQFGYDAVAGHFRGASENPDLAVLVGHKDEDVNTIGTHVYVYKGVDGGYGTWYSNEPDYKIKSMNKAILQDTWNFMNLAYNAGDVNGDGYDDVVTRGSAYWANNNYQMNSYMIIYYGSADGIINTEEPSENPIGLQPRLISSSMLKDMGGTYWDCFGVAAPAGDVNGDGYADIVSLGGATYSGSLAFLFYGSSAGPVLSDAPARVPNSILSPKIINDGGYYAFWYGGTWIGHMFTMVAPSHGDFNGDGYSDIAFRNPGSSQVIITYGGSSGVQSDGVIGDGDIITSGTSADVTGHCTGSGSELICSPFLLVPDTGTEGWWAASVSALGDINGDGYDDLYVGSPYYNSSQGRIFIYYGSEHGLVGANNRTDVDTRLWPAQITGFPAGAYCGAADGGYAGDVNGDKYNDIAVGCYDGYTPSYARFYYGSANGVITGGATVTNALSCADPANCVPLNISVSAIGGFTGFFAYYYTTFNGFKGVGDINMDGYDDVIVRPYNFYKTLYPYSGGGIIYFGSQYGIRADLTASESYQCNTDSYGGCRPYIIVPDQLSYYGAGVSSVSTLAFPIWGDFDNDGSSDIIFGGSSHHYFSTSLPDDDDAKSSLSSIKYWIFR